jgi:peptide/nickel transport system substrate-binding protein
VLANLAPIAKVLMEKARTRVDMQSMDCQMLISRRARQDLPDKGGWNAPMTFSAYINATVTSSAACTRASPAC